MYQTRYGQAIAQILAAYMPGVGVPATVVAALETLVKSAQDAAKTEVRDDYAETVCEGLHPGEPASGLKCLKCYLAEMTFPYVQQVEAEMLAKSEAGDAEESRDEPSDD